MKYEIKARKAAMSQVILVMIMEEKSTNIQFMGQNI